MRAVVAVHALCRLCLRDRRCHRQRMRSGARDCHRVRFAGEDPLCGWQGPARALTSVASDRFTPPAEMKEKEDDGKHVKSFM